MKEIIYVKLAHSKQSTASSPFDLTIEAPAEGVGEAEVQVPVLYEGVPKHATYPGTLPEPSISAL